MSEQPNDAPAADVDVEQPVQTQEPTQPKPTETVDFWKAKAREQESRAKSNADAAKRLQEIEDAAKSAEQRAADEAARAQQSAREATERADRAELGVEHSIGKDFLDLLGGGSREDMASRAERLAPLLAAQRDNEQLRAENGRSAMGEACRLGPLSHPCGRALPPRRSCPQRTPCTHPSTERHSHHG